MKITFLLPGSSRVPVGGYKVVFEYANNLSQRGHQVSIVHPAILDLTGNFLDKTYHYARYALWGTTHAFGPDRWFTLRNEVKILWVPSLNQEHVPDADVVIATGWPTAEFAAEYPTSKGRKFYLLQHLENWWGPDNRVRATWKLPLHKIVIARWLRDLAIEMREQATYIPNGLDFEAFGCDMPVNFRTEPKALMLFHTWEWKGSSDGLKALEIARREIPNLEATLFGVPAAPAKLPPWITYERNPRQKRLRQLYNQTTVFLAPSWAEGWPLPPAEAMMCGAALVCTNIGGHQEYAIHEHNALLAPARDPEALGSALVRIIKDFSLRARLAETAVEEISQFTWTRATDRFEVTLSASHDDD
jgi:glycosyltransferase involved in cell wall biosynthesis